MVISFEHQSSDLLIIKQWLFDVYVSFRLFVATQVYNVGSTGKNNVTEVPNMSEK